MHDYSENVARTFSGKVKHKLCKYVGNYFRNQNQRKERTTIMKRKIIAICLVAVLAISSLTACGSSDNTGNNLNNNAENTGASSEAKPTEGNDEQITLTIWDWDEEHLTHMTQWYQEKHPNINFETLVVSVPDYMQKLQSAIASGSGVPDIILGELGYRGKVFELGILEDLSQEPYQVKKEDMFEFVTDLESGPNGELYGVEQQICPSGLAYRRDLALEYLGTDDPDEISAMISDWDKAFDVGQQVIEKSKGTVTIFPGMTVLFAILMGQNASSYIDGDNINLTQRYMEPLKIAAKFNQAGLLGIQEGGTPALSNSYSAGEVIFYPCAPWSLKWDVAVNDPEGTGNWGLTTAPGGGFTYGGTSVSIYSGSEHKEAAWDYIQEVYCTGDGVKEAYEKYGFMTGFKAPYEDKNSYFTTVKGQYDEYFGGQNLADYFVNTIAINTAGQVQTKNQTNVNTALSTVAAQMTGDPTMTAEDGLEALKKEVQILLPNATLK